MYTEDQQRALDKYSVDGEFREPMVRCDSCQRLVLTEDVKRQGMCECGNTRLRNVRMLNDEELDKARKWADGGVIDGDWLLLWGEVE